MSKKPNLTPAEKVVQYIKEGEAEQAEVYRELVNSGRFNAPAFRPRVKLPAPSTIGVSAAELAGIVAELVQAEHLAEVGDIGQGMRYRVGRLA